MWERVIEIGELTNKRKQREKTLNVIPGRDKTSRLNSVDMETIPKKSIGWKPTCKCGIDTTVPCTVLDPFFGSGTTGRVCIKLGRKYVGCELQENYKPIIEKRTAQQGLF